MIKGSCLCGAIEYEVEETPGKIINCHCSLCRKAHGSAFATQLFARGETLKFLKGEELLSEYQGRRGIRAFCSKCGSRLMNYAADKSQYLSVALACVDSEISDKPIAHAFTDSKAEWHEPYTGIPSYPKLPRIEVD